MILLEAVRRLDVWMIGGGRVARGVVAVFGENDESVNFAVDFFSLSIKLFLSPLSTSF